MLFQHRPNGGGGAGQGGLQIHGGRVDYKNSIKRYGKFSQEIIAQQPYWLIFFGRVVRALSMYAPTFKTLKSSYGDQVTIIKIDI